MFAAVALSECKRELGLAACETLLPAATQFCSDTGQEGGVAGPTKMPAPTGDGTQMLHVHGLEMVRLLDEKLQSTLAAHFAQQEDLIRCPAAV